MEVPDLLKECNKTYEYLQSTAYHQPLFQLDSESTVIETASVTRVDNSFRRDASVLDNSMFSAHALIASISSTKLKVSVVVAMSAELFQFTGFSLQHL